MSKQEYSQAVRDVVRKIGTHAIDWADVVDWLVAGNIGQAIDGGLVTDKAYSLTAKGRELLREMLLEELEEVVAPKSKPSWDNAPDWAMWMAQDSGGAWY